MTVVRDVGNAKLKVLPHVQSVNILIFERNALRILSANPAKKFSEIVLTVPIHSGHTENFSAMEAERNLIQKILAAVGVFKRKPPHIQYTLRTRLLGILNFVCTNLSADHKLGQKRFRTFCGCKRVNFFSAAQNSDLIRNFHDLSKPVRNQNDTVPVFFE